MAFSGHYFCGCKKDTPANIDKVPLYYLESDIVPYCDAAVKVSAPGTYLGHLYAPAKDPTLTDADYGYTKITKQSSTLVQNFSGHCQYDDIWTNVIHGGSTGVIIKELSCTVNYNCSYGAKSDGWCGTRITSWLDGEIRWDTTNPVNATLEIATSAHIVKSWGGSNKLISIQAKDIKIPPGDHLLRVGASTHASGGDGAYFKVNWFSLTCDSLKKHQIPSSMRMFKTDENKEYVLCRGFDNGK